MTNEQKTATKILLRAYAHRWQAPLGTMHDDLHPDAQRILEGVFYDKSEPYPTEKEYNFIFKRASSNPDYSDYTTKEILDFSKKYPSDLFARAYEGLTEIATDILIDPYIQACTVKFFEDLAPYWVNDPEVKEQAIPIFKTWDTRS